MLDQMANHASSVRRLIEDVGQDPVESFIDCCLSIENLIDVQSQFDSTPKRPPEGSEPDTYRQEPVKKMRAKKYMDSYINPKDFIEKQKEKRSNLLSQQKSFPEKPERDILRFLIEYAPLNPWERRLLNIAIDSKWFST